MPAWLGMRFSAELTRSAIRLRIRAAYSSCSGSRNTRSPLCSAAAGSCAGPVLVVDEKRGIGEAERRDGAAGQRRDVD